MKLEQFFLSALAAEAAQIAQASLSMQTSSPVTGMNASFLDDSFCRLIGITKMMHYHQIPLSMHFSISSTADPVEAVKLINNHITQTYVRLEDLIRANGIQLTAPQIKAMEVGAGLSLGNEYPL